MSTKNPNYYQEENINNDGVIPTKKWATEGQSPSVGLSMDNTGYLFNSNLNQGYGITNPDAELLEKINIREALLNGDTPDEAMAYAQSASDKFGRALVNNLVIAGTTAVQGTLGFLYGAFDAIANEEFSRLWDNDINRALYKTQREFTENNAIYRTEEYNNSSIWQKMGKSTFWAELIQNLGYSEGMMIPGMGASKLLSSAPKALQVIFPSLLGSIGEASIEALTNKDDKIKLETTQLSQEFQKKYDNAASDEEREQLYGEYQQQLINNEEDANKAGNFVFGFNVGVLTLSNMLEWGRVFAGSASKTKNLVGKAKRVANIEGKTPQIAQSSLALQKAKDVGQYILGATSEGLEEVSQGIIQKAASLNYDYNSFNDSIFNPESREMADDMLKSFILATGEAMKDKQTAEEFMMGFMTSVIGTPSIRSFRKSDGGYQLPINIEGGVLNLTKDLRQTSKNYNRTQKVIDEINKGLKDETTKKRYEGLVRSLDITKRRNDAALNNDEFLYKTMQDAGIINDVITYASVGQLDLLKEIAQNASNLSDEDINSIVGELKNDSTGSGIFSDGSGNVDASKIKDRINYNAERITSTIDKFGEKKQEIENKTNFQLTDEALNNAIYASLQIDNFIEDRDDILESLYYNYTSESIKQGIPSINKQEFNDKILKEDKSLLQQLDKMFDKPDSPIRHDVYSDKINYLKRVSEAIKEYQTKLDEAISKPSKANKEANDSKLKAVDKKIEEKRNAIKDRLKKSDSTASYRKEMQTLLGDDSVSNDDIEKANEELISEGDKNANENRTIENIKKSSIAKIMNSDKLSQKQKTDIVGLINAAIEYASNSKDFLNTAFSQDNEVFKSIYTTNPEYNKENDKDGKVYKEFLYNQYTALSAIKEALKENKQFEYSQRITVKNPTVKDDKGEQDKPVYNYVDSHLENTNITSEEQDKEQIADEKNERERMKTTSWIPLSWFDFKSKDLFKLVPISSVDSFKNISNYITDHGVQRYVDEGNLNIGDKLYFGIDPKCVDNNNNPAILYFKEIGENNYQPVGVFQVTEAAGETANALKEKLLKEFHEKGDKPYISNITTTVNSLKTGYMVYGNKQDADGVLTEGIEFFIQNPDGSIVSGKSIDNLKYVRDPKAKAYTLFAAIPILKGKIKIPVQINIKHFNPTEYSEEAYGNTDYYKKIKSLVERLSTAKTGDDVMRASNELRDILYLGDYDFYLNNNRLLISKLERDVYGKPVKVEKNGKLVNKKNVVNNIDLAEANAKDTLFNWILDSNFRFQVTSKLLNTKNYNSTLLSNGILTTNLASLNAVGNWFTVNPLNNNFEEVKGTPLQFPQQKPTTQRGVIDNGHTITYKGKENYIIAKDNTGKIHIYSPSGTEIARNSSDGKNSFEYMYEYVLKYGNSLNGNGLINGVFLTSDGIYFNAIRGRYATQKEIEDFNKFTEPSKSTQVPQEQQKAQSEETSSSNSMDKAYEKLKEELPKENYAENDNAVINPNNNILMNYYDKEDKKWHRGTVTRRTLANGRPVYFVLRRSYSTGTLDGSGELKQVGYNLGIITESGVAGFLKSDIQSKDISDFVDKTLEQLNNTTERKFKILKSKLNTIRKETPEIIGEKEEPLSKEESFTTNEEEETPYIPSSDNEVSLNDFLNEDSNEDDDLSLRVVTDTKEKIGNISSALKWLKTVLPHIPISVYNGILKINNVEAWGKVSKAGITLSNILAEGTEYHEAFHIVSRYALTEEERNSLYKEASVLTKSSDNLVNEEWLAEQFRIYMMNRNSLGKRIKLSIRRFFVRISNFIKGIKEVEPYRNVVFKNIMENKYSDTRISTTKEDTFKSLDRKISDEQLREAGHSDLWLENANKEDKEIAMFCIGV